MYAADSNRRSVLSLVLALVCLAAIHFAAPGARAQADCPCDWDNSGGVPDTADFFAFLDDFFNGEADFDGDGISNSKDFFAFVDCFFEVPEGCRSVFCVDSTGEIELTLDPEDPAGKSCVTVAVSWAFDIPCVMIPPGPYETGVDIVLPVRQFQFLGFSETTGYLRVVGEPDAAETVVRITEVVASGSGEFVSGRPVFEAAVRLELLRSHPFPLVLVPATGRVQMVGGTITSLPPMEGLFATTVNADPIALTAVHDGETTGYLCAMRCASPPAPPRPLPARHACPNPLPAGCRTTCPTGATVTLVGQVRTVGAMTGTYGGLFRYTFTPAAMSRCVEVREVVTTLAGADGCGCNLPIGAANAIIIPVNLRCTANSILDLVTNQIRLATPPAAGCVTTSTQQLQCRPKGSTDDAAWMTFQTQTMTYRRNANGTIEVIITPMGGAGVSTGQIMFP